MNKRLVLVLCACFALVIGLSLWLLANSPPATQEQAALQRDGEPVGGLTQVKIQTQTQTEVPAEQRGNSTETRSSVENSAAPASGNEDSANTSGAQQAQASANLVASTTANTRTQEESAAPVLSEYVFAMIEDVQQKQLDGQWEESLIELNALYEDFDELNTFEQTILLNFYTNTLLRFEMWPEAIGAFSRMLTIPDLRPDLGARALMALGQLHAQVGEYAASITYLRSWQDMTVGMENMERSNQRVEQLLAQTRLAQQQAALEEQ